MKSYQEFLKDYLNNPFNVQAFNLHVSIALMCTDDKSVVSFKDPRKLLQIDNKSFIYSDNNTSESFLMFTVPPETTHILYDTTGEEGVLTVPLVLNIKADGMFAVFLSEGWVEFSYPLKSTAINADQLYKVQNV